MKKTLSYLSAVAVLVLVGFTPAYAVAPPPPVPEPGTMAVLGAIAVGGLVARRIIKRK